ncbi:MAG: WYL domain-containing protein [Chitinophagaceae bacterium]|nr:MAG: WYL domain-containing protein [Chitinophagaceae bacterium]
MKELLKLIMLLSSNRSYTLIEIAQRFDKSERTIFRYLEDIELAGFILEKKRVGKETQRYRLMPNHSETKTFKKLFHFSEEEDWLLHQTLHELKAGSTIKDKLLKKLNFLYDFKAIANLENTKDLEKTNLLNDAINRKKMVKLIHYRSSNSDTIEDRTVEPFDFIADYEGIWCYEIESQHVKQFKISRIEDVEILNENWRHQSEHKIPFTDAFKMSAKKPIAIFEAQLSLKAYNLLCEEFPLAEKSISVIDNNRYHLKIPIADFHGIGRFVLGLPGDIKVMAPKEFKEFLKEKAKLYFD